MEQRFPFKLGNRWVMIGAIALGVLSLVGTIGYVAFFRGNSSTSSEAGDEAVEVLQTDYVTALGRLEPEGEVITIAAPANERVGQLLVQEGDNVNPVQAIAYLESYPERLAERDLAASQLTEARAQLDAETLVGNAQIQEARARREQVNDPKIAAIAAQQATIQRIAAELDSAQREYKRFLELHNAGAVSLQDLDDRTVVVRSREEDLRNAQANLARLQQERRTDLENANAQLQSAQANLTRSQVMAQVASATSNLQLAQARLDRTIIRAPRKGQILKVHAKEGESVTEQGIAQLGNTAQMYVVAEVYETDMPRIRFGQRATVTSMALPESLTGSVAHLGLLVDKNDVLDTDPAAKTDVRVVEVKIRLDRSEPVAGLTNMQVEVRIDPTTSTAQIQP